MLIFLFLTGFFFFFVLLLYF